MNSGRDSTRDLILRLRGALGLLAALGRVGFPTPEGRSFDDYVSRATTLLAELQTRQLTPGQQLAVNACLDEVRRGGAQALETQVAQQLFADALNRMLSF